MAASIPVDEFTFVSSHNLNALESTNDVESRGSENFDNYGLCDDDDDAHGN